MKKIIKIIIPAKIRSLMRRIQMDARERMDYAADSKSSLKLMGSILAEGGVIKLDLGSGGVKGSFPWYTLDLRKGADFRFNLLNQLPIPNDSIDEVYCSHFLEHFETGEILYIMAEVHRILKPGKRFSCCVPNIKYFLNGYTEPDVFAAKMKGKVYEPALQYYSPVDWVNYLAYMGGEHKHLFDDENLTILMKEAGYVDVSSRGFGHEKDMPGRREQSIYAEAYKAIS